MLQREPKILNLNVNRRLRLRVPPRGRGKGQRGGGSEYVTVNRVCIRNREGLPVIQTPPLYAWTIFDIVGNRFINLTHTQPVHTWNSRQNAPFFYSWDLLSCHQLCAVFNSCDIWNCIKLILLPLNPYPSSHPQLTFSLRPRKAHVNTPSIHTRLPHTRRVI